MNATLPGTALLLDGRRDDEPTLALAHEALHCALGHFARRGHRVRHRWDLACDFAINPVLAGQGLTPPAEAVMPLLRFCTVGGIDWTCLIS